MDCTLEPAGSDRTLVWLRSGYWLLKEGLRNIGNEPTLTTELLLKFNYFLFFKIKKNAQGGAMSDILSRFGQQIRANKEYDKCQSR